MRTDTPETLLLNLDEYRIRASRLLKELRGADLALGLRAANRFCALPGFADQAPGDIYNSRDQLKRKHSLTVIAKEAGFNDWPALKAAMPAKIDIGFDTTKLFQPRTANYLNLWYRTYAEAREVLTIDEGNLESLNLSAEAAGIIETSTCERTSTGTVEPRIQAAHERGPLPPKRYLFPYRHQFVVCEGQLLEEEGIDTADPDWERIGRDWVKPLDAKAHARLAVRLRRVVK